MPIYAVKRAGEEATRLFRADRRSQVESKIISEHIIERATAEQAVELGAAGVKIEDATFT